MPNDAGVAEEAALFARLDALAAALTAKGVRELAGEAAAIARLIRANDNLLRLAEVKHRTGLSTSEIYRREAAGTFPQARQIGARVVAWSAAEIAAWVASRPMRATRAGRKGRVAA